MFVMIKISVDCLPLSGSSQRQLARYVHVYVCAQENQTSSFEGRKVIKSSEGNLVSDEDTTDIVPHYRPVLNTAMAIARTLPLL